MSYDKFAQSAEKRARIVEAHRAGHLATQAADRLEPLDRGSDLKIRREDIEVFAAAAEYFNHIIAVRATNPASLGYVGEKLFTPKPIDCKPKTADNNAYVPKAGLQVECAGLVVDPTVVGSSAFKDKKAEKARESWAGFLKDKTDDECKRGVFRRRDTKGFYAVDLDRSSRRYGCLMLCEQNEPRRDFNLALSAWQDFKRTQMRYIHGDYDLYGLIDVDRIERAVRIHGRDKLSPELIYERLHGVPHVFTGQFPAIRDFLNSGIGAEMIQHASQDNVGHQADEIYVFYPLGGKYRLEASADGMRDIYLRLFKQDVVT